MTIRCKFRCASILDFGKNCPKKVEFSTQYDPTLPEDIAFTKATPSGSMIVSIDNPAALAALEPGKSYYVDLVPC